jgi:hypothetical protein
MRTAKGIACLALLLPPIGTNFYSFDIAYCVIAWLARRSDEFGTRVPKIEMAGTGPAITTITI